jgi:uncharacterized protein YegP (UPF0339 family)
MNLIWRFYRDQNRLWRWQHLAFNLEVVAESRKGYKEYEDCVESAVAQGYVSLPSQTTRAKASGHARTRW